MKLPFKQGTEIRCTKAVGLVVTYPSGRKRTIIIKIGDVLVQTTSTTNKQSLFARKKTAKIGLGYWLDDAIIEKYFEVLE
jgi:hypothetical protein